jgi:DNA-binding transcriptional regulator YhcF (GntR family)
MTAARTRGRATRGRSSRTEEVQQAIKQLILERGLASGDPMPTEFELVEELDVSRNSLREALKALQAVGIVEIRHGFGMYVGSMSLGALVDELTFHARMSKRQGRDDLAHLVDVREVLERGLVEQVIDRHLLSDTTELDEIMRRMDAEAAAGQVTSARSGTSTGRCSTTSRPSGRRRRTWRSGTATSTRRWSPATAGRRPPPWRRTSAASASASARPATAPARDRRAGAGA